MLQVEPLASPRSSLCRVCLFPLVRMLLLSNRRILVFICFSAGHLLVVAQGGESRLGGEVMCDCQIVQRESYCEADVVSAADDAISPPQPSVSGCTQGISSSAGTAGHTFQALAEKLVRHVSTSRTKHRSLAWKDVVASVGSAARPAPYQLTTASDRSISGRW